MKLNSGDRNNSRACRQEKNIFIGNQLYLGKMFTLKRQEVVTEIAEPVSRKHPCAVPSPATCVLSAVCRVAPWAQGAQLALRGPLRLQTVGEFSRRSDTGQVLDKKCPRLSQLSFDMKAQVQIDYF